MSKPLKVGVAGLARLGRIQALHVHELARDSGICELAAVAEINRERALQFTSEIGQNVPIFLSIEEFSAFGGL